MYLRIALQLPFYMGSSFFSTLKVSIVPIFVGTSSAFATVSLKVVKLTDHEIRVTVMGV